MDDKSISVEFYTAADHHGTPNIHSQFQWNHSSGQISTLSKFLANLHLGLAYICGLHMNMLFLLLIISMAMAYFNFIVW